MKENPMLPAPQDQVAIADLLARYCLALDVDDVDAWVGLFTADAVYEVFGRAFEGHEGLRQMMDGAPGGLHLGGPPVIDMIDDDHATTTRNLLFIDRSDGVSRSAIYTDALTRTRDGWRIAHIRCKFIVPGGLSDRPAR
jgi:ketosteroid isomerase-like protein